MTFQSAPVTFSWLSLQRLTTRSRDFSSFHHGLNPEFFPGLILCGESPVPYLAVWSQVTLILLWIEPLYSQTRDRDIQSRIEHVNLRWSDVIWVSLNHLFESRPAKLFLLQGKKDLSDWIPRATQSLGQICFLCSHLTFKPIIFFPGPHTHFSWTGL